MGLKSTSPTRLLNAESLLPEAGEALVPPPPGDNGALAVMIPKQIYFATGAISCILRVFGNQSARIPSKHACHVWRQLLTHELGARSSANYALSMELVYGWWAPSSMMSLACLVCHRVESPSQSFRSYSVSSSDEGRCSIIINCLNKKSSFGPEAPSSMITSSKVTPHPLMVSSQGVTGAPRLVRSRAVRRDLVRDWNFDEIVMDR